ncbi:hypothetical protein K491DRAFT_698848 [Lophiostoma macrostomum CBS 122681]|uniref:Uncharacterized protein n=1 Tax=Lophiostoma macrostomum CBS 122681 TaxID=1314788 RepID=A0A6A6SNG5_9PLEO|nr:hypothetical protein K491DRAFT_698848 [Lophiostoma macrostomum CBS 122681]
MLMTQINLSTLQYVFRDRAFGMAASAALTVLVMLAASTNSAVLATLSSSVGIAAFGDFGDLY